MLFACHCPLEMFNGLPSVQINGSRCANLDCVVREKSSFVSGLRFFRRESCQTRLKEVVMTPSYLSVAEYRSWASGFVPLPA